MHDKRLKDKKLDPLLEKTYKLLKSTKFQNDYGDEIYLQESIAYEISVFLICKGLIKEEYDA